MIKRLLRRAVLDGHQLGMRDPFLYQLVPVVAKMMSVPYPELTETIDRVSQVMKREESDFFNTIDGGLERIGRLFTDMESNRTVMSMVVKPPISIKPSRSSRVAPSLGRRTQLDLRLGRLPTRYGRARRDQWGRAKRTFQDRPIETLKEAVLRTEFLGYETTAADATIQGIIVGPPRGDHLAKSVQAGETGDALLRVVLDRSPFYGESGGQVGDKGTIQGAGFVSKFLIRNERAI